MLSYRICKFRLKRNDSFEKYFKKIQCPWLREVKNWLTQVKYKYPQKSVKHAMCLV